MFGNVTLIGKLSNGGLDKYFERDKIAINRAIVYVFRDAKTSFGSDIIELKKFHIDCLSQAECYVQGVCDSDKHCILIYFDRSKNEWQIEHNVPNLDGVKIISILTRCDISNQKDFVDENDFDFILKLDKMSPEQAIKHLERRAQINAGYKQMIFWLLDLKELREIAPIWHALDSLKQM